MTSMPSTADEPLPSPPIRALVGHSLAMERLREAIRAKEKSRLVVLRGESGVGKSLVARVFISQWSRCDAEVFRIRCRQVDDERALRIAAVVRQRASDAKSCVLYLDEFCEAHADLQDELFERISGLSRNPSLRVVATTARAVERFAADGFLRELCKAEHTIWIPPLRVRRSDIRHLVYHFMRPTRSCAFDADAMHLLEEQKWPRNIRQLREVVSRLGLLHDRVTSREVRRELLHARNATNAQ